MNLTFFKNLSLLICLLSISGCTTVHFKNSGEINLYVGGKMGHNKRALINGKSEFYLFGIIPERNHTIYIDRELKKKAGLNSAANISIHEYQTTSDMIYSILSMGFYIPTRYEITAFGEQENSEEDPNKR